MNPNGIVTPTPATLRRYGLSEDQWRYIAEGQGWRCPCGRIPGNGRFNIDHEHVRGWKAMKPEARRQYVRGLVCWTCNKFTLARNASPEQLRLLADYLETYASERQ